MVWLRDSFQLQLLYLLQLVWLKVVFIVAPFAQGYCKAMQKTYQNITFENRFYKPWSLLVSQGSGAGKVGKKEEEESKRKKGHIWRLFLFFCKKYTNK